MCAARAILPKSCTLPVETPDVDAFDLPFSMGGYGEAYKGTLDGSIICVKRLRVNLQVDPQVVPTVCFLRTHFSRS